MAKSSLLIWRYIVNVKSTVNISSIFVAFSENMNFNKVTFLQLIFFLFKLLTRITNKRTTFCDIIDNSQESIPIQLIRNPLFLFLYQLGCSSHAFTKSQLRISNFHKCFYQSDFFVEQQPPKTSKLIMIWLGNLWKMENWGWKFIKICGEQLRFLTSKKTLKFPQ